MLNAETTLLIFARYPVAGAAKTRLIPALGAEGAAAAHRLLCEVTLATARNSIMAKCVAYFGGDLAEFQNWLGTDISYEQQIDGDLGEKLTAAAASQFQQGVKKLLIVGSDCPYITPDHYAEATKALDTHDVVIGPALDGGYYLIGLRAVHPLLFANINWSTDKVFAQTCNAAANLGLKVHVLDILSDIDFPEDWNAWLGVRQK
jgi:uncharacterized protein